MSNLHLQFLSAFIAASWNWLVIWMSDLQASTAWMLFTMKSQDTCSRCWIKSCNCICSSSSVAFCRVSCICENCSLVYSWICLSGFEETGLLFNISGCFIQDEVLFGTCWIIAAIRLVLGTVGYVYVRGSSFLLLPSIALSLFAAAPLASLLLLFLLSLLKYF